MVPVYCPYCVDVGGTEQLQGGSDGVELGVVEVEQVVSLDACAEHAPLVVAERYALIQREIEIGPGGLAH